MSDQEKVFTRQELQFVAGIVYAKMIKRYGVRMTSSVNFTPDELADLREMMDEALKAMGHQTYFELEAMDEIEKLLQNVPELPQ